MLGPVRIQALTPNEVAAMLKRGEIALIDVREPQEYAASRIHGAMNFPLSTFDPKALPHPSDRLTVFLCGSGKRSSRALELCQNAGVDIEHHLSGGLAAWRAQGLPAITIDPTTGAVNDPSAVGDAARPKGSPGQR